MIKYLTTTLVLCFLCVSFALAAGNKKGPKTLPQENYPNETASQRDSKIPPLVQQEIEKVKALKQETNQIIDNQQGVKENGLKYVKSNVETTTKVNRENQVKKRRIEQINKYTKNLAERFGILIARENQIKNRIQTRITKFEENGFDMLEAKQSLLETENHLESIQNKVKILADDIVAMIEKSQATEEFQNEVENFFEQVRTETRLLKEDFKNAHKELVQVVEKIKEKYKKQLPPTN